MGDLLSDGAGEVRRGLWVVGGGICSNEFSQIEALLYERREISTHCAEPGRAMLTEAEHSK